MIKNKQDVKITSEDLERAFQQGELVGENTLLKRILEQKLDIELIPKLKMGDL